jgi:Ca-activated chloride channel homolog
LLRESQYKGVGDYKMVLNLAERSKGSDTEGYRSEFMRLVKTIH